MAAKVIVVEPEKEQQEQFLAAIKGSAFEVCEFTNTNAEAVEKYEVSRPHLLVLRLVSGKLGADVALDSLRKKNATAKVVVSYDVRSTYLLMAAYAHGAAAAVKRPFRLHRIVEKLTYAIASEHHDKLGGPIVRLEHPIQVRYKGGSFLARSRVGFCERLGLTDMDLNTEKTQKVKSELKIELLLPPPTGSMKFLGVVEDIEATVADNWCAYVALKNVSPEHRTMIEAFLVKAARKV